MKILKIILKIIGYIAAFVIGTCLLVAGCMQLRNYQLKKELADANKKCAELTKISGPVALRFINFKNKDLVSVRFQILRNKKLMEDSLVNFEETELNQGKISIPYSEFLKTDTIVLTTKNNLKFYIAGFHHVTGYNYGMFGPVGDPLECGLADDFSVNKTTSVNYMAPDLAVPGNKIDDRIAYYRESGKEFDSVQKLQKINAAQAQDIYEKSRIDPRYVNNFMRGIAIQKSANFYYFEEEINGKKVVTLMNTADGSLQKFTNYPLE